MSWEINLWKLAINGLIGKKSCKKQKKNIRKNSQESVIKTCHKTKKTRLKSTKGKNIKNWFSIKKEALKNK